MPALRYRKTLHLEHCTCDLALHSDSRHLGKFAITLRIWPMAFLIETDVRAGDLHSNSMMVNGRITCICRWTSTTLSFLRTFDQSFRNLHPKVRQAKHLALRAACLFAILLVVEPVLTKARSVKWKITFTDHFLLLIFIRCIKWLTSMPPLCLLYNQTLAGLST